MARCMLVLAIIVIVRGAPLPKDEAEELALLQEKLEDLSTALADRGITLKDDKHEEELKAKELELREKEREFRAVMAADIEDEAPTENQVTSQTVTAQGCNQLTTKAEYLACRRGATVTANTPSPVQKSRLAHPEEQSGVPSRRSSGCNQASLKGTAEYLACRRGEAMTVNAKAPGKKSSEPPSKEEKVTVNEKSLTQKAKEGDEGMVPPTQKSKEGDEGMVKEEVVSHVHKHVRRT